MFGNSQGWMISAAVGLVMGWLLYYVAVPPARTDPTNAESLAIAEKTISLPVAWSTAVSPGTKDCDASDAYQKAIDDYQLTPRVYYQFTHGEQMTIKEHDMSAIGDILNGRDCRNFNLFRKDPTKVVNYDNTEPTLEALADAGNICCTMGKLYTNENYPDHQPQKAVQLWEAAFVLGAHLYDERMSWAELAAGHGLMQTAALDLRDHYKGLKNQGEVDRLQKFLDEEGAYQLPITKAFSIIGGVDESYAGKYAGDIFLIAESKPPMQADAMFRVEAIKHIGHYRYNANTSGDQLAARRVLRVLSEGADLPPNVKAAANAARDLTLDKHNMVGGGATQ